MAAQKHVVETGEQGEMTDRPVGQVLSTCVSHVDVLEVSRALFWGDPSGMPRSKRSFLQWRRSFASLCFNPCTAAEEKGRGKGEDSGDAAAMASNPLGMASIAMASNLRAMASNRERLKGINILEPFLLAGIGDTPLNMNRRNKSLQSVALLRHSYFLTIGLADRT